jgi:FKBP-type peptidyl-prolyl cis-trans isomerase FkpA
LKFWLGEKAFNMSGNQILQVFFVVIIMMAASMLSSCRRDEDPGTKPGIREFQDALIESNIYLIELEDEVIDDFLERYGWKMNQTGSGLRYRIDRQGAGPLATYGNTAVIEYEVYLITGDKVYSSAELGLKSFTVGRGGVESGIEEGILFMNKGAKATFIMPYYLAHGVPGDGDKIPRRATIIYQIELIELYNNHIN